MGARISNFMEWEGAWSTLRSAWPQARCVSTILAAKKGHIAGKLSRIAMLRLELRLLKSSIIIIFCISINDIIIIIIIISQLDHLSTSLSWMPLLFTIPPLGVLSCLGIGINQVANTWVHRSLNGWVCFKHDGSYIIYIYIIIYI